MKTLIKRLAVSTIRRATDSVLFIPSALAVHLQKRHREANITEFNRTPRANYAIIASYPTGGIPVFLKNLLEGFSQNQVGVILVSNVPLSPSDREYAARYVSILIERCNVGRDFGAYQTGLAHFESLEWVGPYNKLMLVNDTLFYSKYTGQLIAQMLENDEPFLGAFENFSHHYHVGSFFLCFARRVIQADAFKTFWKRYRPYSTRYHCIMAGEVGLTKALMRAGFTPSVIYSTTALRLAIMRFAEAGPESLATLIASWIPESWTNRNFPGMGSSAGAASGTHLLNAFLRKCEKVNQSHALALCANIVMGVPFIKKDICYRDYWSIASAVLLPQGFDAEERGEMLRTLRRKGIPESFSALRRLCLLLDL